MHSEVRAQTNSGTAVHEHPVRLPRPVKIGQFVAVLIPAIIALIILYRQAFSLPYMDDYHSILDFAIQYQQCPTWIAKFREIIGHQHNEYKLILEHFIVAANLELAGHLNFCFLIALGNLFLLPLSYLLWRIHVSEETPSDRLLLRFVPISLLFFSLTYWETLDWAMVGLQNIPVILFVLLSLKLLFPGSHSSANRRVLWSSVSAVLGSMASANGFLLAPVGLFILLRRRAYAATLTWCASFTIPLAAYLYRYVPRHQPYVASAANTVFFFIFSGAAVPGVHNAVRALIGILVIAAFGLSARHRFDRSHPTSFYFTIWILMCGGLIALLRGPIAPRYTIYSLLLFIYIYKFILFSVQNRIVRIDPKIVFRTLLVVVILVCLTADIDAYIQLGKRKAMVVDGMKAFIANPEFNSPMVDTFIEKNAPGEGEYERIELIRSIQCHVIPMPDPSYF